MQWLRHLDFSIVLTFTLVLTRVSGLVVTAPIYGGNELPMQIRGLFAFAIALLILPTQWGVSVPEPASLPMFAIVIVGELIIGLTLGLGVQILFSSVQMAGEMIGRIGGLMLADVFDPGSETSIPLFSKFLHLVALAVFVTIGGHRIVMAGLLDTFQTLPLGRGEVPESASEAIIALASTSFELGFRVAAPAVTALLLATIVLSIVGRTLPQLNIMAVGFGLNAVLTFLMIFVGLGTAIWVFQEQVAPALETLFAGLKAPLRSELFH